MRFGDLQRVSGWIAEIDRPNAVRPVELSLDFNIRRQQPRPHPQQVLPRLRETDVPGASGAVRRNWQTRISGRFHGLIRIEQKQHAGAAAVKHMPVADPLDELEPEHTAVELLSSVQIVNV